jgi:signal transduction histidine kinase
MRKSLSQLHLPRYCAELGVPLTSCPPVLFIVMGIVVIGAILGTYAVAQRYAEPEIAVLIVLGLTMFLLVIGYLIVGAFERLADSRTRERRYAADLIALKDQFVFLAAHELRAPATAIKWALESLEDGSPESLASRKESLQVITQNTMRLLGLVRDLLETARIESHALRISLHPVRLSDALAGAVAELKDAAESHTVTIASSLAESLPQVLADPVRLKEILHHLLSNAIKFSNRGGTVEVSASPSDSGVLISVTDHGAGIRAEDQPHIFEKFWRSAEAQFSLEHSGLGLFITKQLVEMLGGAIRFSSTQGSGTTFSIELKRAEG